MSQFNKNNDGGFQGWFRTMKNGDIVFKGQPWEPEYLVTEKQKDHIIRLHIVAMTFLTAMAVATVKGIGTTNIPVTIFGVGAIMVGFSAYLIIYRKITNNLIVSPYTVLSYGESIRHGVTTINWQYFVILLPFFHALFYFLLMAYQNKHGYYILMLVIFFGFMSIFFDVFFIYKTYLALTKNKQR